MKSHRPLLCRAALTLLCLTMAVSCASDESTASLNRRLRERNDRYLERQEQRKMRARARQKRVDMWFDRLMH